MAKAVAEACRYVLELDIPDDEPVDVWIQKLTARVRNARIELAKVQFDLNLNIAELQLKAQPSTPLEVREKHKRDVEDAIVVVNNSVKECTTLFEQVLEVVTNLQEDPTLQRLEMEAWELQQTYD